MQAYLNDESIKAKTLKAMHADIAAERLVKGTYWNSTKKNGCFVGCVIRGSEHQKFVTKLGIPRILARLGDRLFEGLPYEEAKQFAIDFLDAIPVGVDLSGVWDKFALYMLVDAAHGVIRVAKSAKTKKIIQAVADLYARKIGGEKIDVNEWLAARKNADAYAADAYAADADADAYAAAAAYAYAAAAYADAYAAAADAYAAAAAADAYAARSRHYVALATYLIKLFREAGQL